MDNREKPREKRADRRPSPGQLYDSVAAVVARLREGIALSEEAGVPVALDFRRALSQAIIVEIQLAAAVVETN